jgi:hypothetical protein
MTDPHQERWNQRIAWDEETGLPWVRPILRERLVCVLSVRGQIQRREVTPLLGPFLARCALTGEPIPGDPDGATVLDVQTLPPRH